MVQYTLTEEELSNFSDDNVRAEIRFRVANLHSNEGAIVIVDSEGNEWDRVTGGSELSVPELSDEEQAAQALETLRNEEEAHRLETVIRPLVMHRLMSEARMEVRAELRENANAKLELQALKANQAKDERTTANRQKLIDTRNNAEVARLMGKVESLALENESLKAKLAAKKDGQ